MSIYAAGMITTNNLPYWVLNEPEYLYLGHRLAQITERWASTVNNGWLQIRYKSCVTVGAGEEMYVGYGGETGLIETRTGPLTREWSAAWIGPRSCLDAENLDASSQWWPTVDGTQPHGRHEEIAVWTDDRGHTGYLHSVMVELVHYVAYDGILPAAATTNGAAVETIDRTGATFQIFAPYTPVSSWQMRSIVSASYNYAAYQARLLLCVPFYKTAVS